MHWPFYQYKTARNLWKSPLHKALIDEGACFGEVGGYERANWFSRNGESAQYKYSYKRQNWFDFYAAEHLSIRESVGIYDISSFGKFQVKGKNAMKTLQFLSCADVDVAPGNVVYTQWLNDRGGIEADLTISRLDETNFHVITSISSLMRDWSYLNDNLMTDTFAEDVTLKFGCLSVQGPNSRMLLQEITDTNLANDEFAFGTGQYSKLANENVWIQKLSYVGELGWEIFAPSEHMLKIYRTIQTQGKKYNLCNVGLHAVNSLRLEKGYRHWGHDIAAEDSLIEAGLSFTAKPDRSDFIGKDAYLTELSNGVPSRRLVQFKLEDPEPLLYHNEPIIMNGKISGYLSSAMYGHSVGSSIGMGYITAENLNQNTLNETNFEIEIATKRYKASSSLKALYDPEGLNMKL